MRFSYQLTTLIIGILIAGGIILLIRRDHMHIRHSILWFLFAAVSVVFGAYPMLIDKIAVVLGVHYPPVLLIVVGMGVILIKILTMDIERSKYDRDLRILIERLAVYEGDKESRDLE